MTRSAAAAANEMGFIRNRSSGLPEMDAREPIEQLRQRLAVQREAGKLGLPREFITPGQRRHPNLPHGGVRRDDELRIGGLFENEVQNAVLQLDFEAVTVRQWQKRTACGFERFVAFHAEFLLGKGGHMRLLNLSRTPSV